MTAGWGAPGPVGACDWLSIDVEGLGRGKFPAEDQGGAAGQLTRGPASRAGRGAAGKPRAQGQAFELSLPGSGHLLGTVQPHTSLPGRA